MIQMSVFSSGYSFETWSLLLWHLRMEKQSESNHTHLPIYSNHHGYFKKINFFKMKFK